MYNFNEYKSMFNNQLKKKIDKEFDNQHIKNMILYSLDGGKRLRPIIAIDICLSLGKKIEDVIDFAIGIELIHNASLIIDDLPCMDNDDYRRGKLSFHKKFSLYDAEFVSRIMLSTALKFIYLNFKSLNQKIFNLITKNIIDNLGINGATGGQLLDLTPININSKKDLLDNFKNKEFVQELLDKKTSTFFEIAFIGGFVCGNGNLEHIEVIKSCARNFGLAFQLYDDFDDIEQDKLRIDLGLNDPNYINNFGIKETKKIFKENVELFTMNMSKQNIYSQTMKELITKLTEKLYANKDKV